jgi:hypothetical protein
VKKNKELLGNKIMPLAPNKYGCIKTSFVDTQLRRILLEDYIINQVSNKREGVSIFRYIMSK